MQPNLCGLQNLLRLTTFSPLEKERRADQTALRLGRYFGNSAQFWMNLQAGYDLAVAERDFGEKVAKEVEAA